MTRTPITALLTLLLVSAAQLQAQQDVFSLEGLVITASPTPLDAEVVSSHVTVLTADDLTSFGGRTLGEALRAVAGVGVARSGSFGAVTSVFTRGGESDYTLVLVDGVQVNLPGGGFDFASLPIDNVERVEIVRGPASALYGSDAVTGVIHVVTTTGRGAPRARASMQAGSFGRRDWSGDFAAGTERSAYSVSVSRRATEGVLAFNNQHTATVLSGRARFQPDARTDVSVSLRSTENEYHFPTDGSGAALDTNAFTFGDGTVGQVAVRRQVLPRLALEARVGLNELDSGFDDAPDGTADTLGFYGFASLDHFRRVSGELRAHLTSERGTLTFGFELEDERQRSFTESLSEFGPATGRSSYASSNRAGFVHGTGEVGPLSLTAGSRVEDDQRFGTLATGRMGVSWLALGRLGSRLRASVGSAIKAPTFAESFSTGFALGNPALEPERSRSWEVGVEQPLLGGRAHLSGTYFDQRFSDLIQYTFVPPSPGDPNFFNVAEATSRGLEADVTVAAGPVRAGFTWTVLDTEVVDPGFDVGPGATFVQGEALLRRPATSWALRASMTAGAVRLSGRLERVGSRSDRDFATFPATPVTLDAYDLLSLGAEWTIATAPFGASGLIFTVGADNVLDHDYQEVLGFGAPGRAVYLGLSVGVGGGG